VKEGNGTAYPLDNIPWLSKGKSKLCGWWHREPKQHYENLARTLQLSKAN